jgi:phage terminase large subunit GpA-like protein
MERYHVPCPDCGELQILRHAQLRWEHSKTSKKRVLDASTVRYECEHCRAQIPETDQDWMVSQGRWVAEHPERTTHRSFHLPALYSPWVPWPDYVREWLAAQDDTERLKTFINTRMAETFEEAGEALDELPLFERREDYDPSQQIPAGVAVITAAVDVQDDRLELEIKGWGRGRESWSLEYLTLQGDPSVVDPINGRACVWSDLDALLDSRIYRHPSGAGLRVSAVGIDTGGHCTDAVYRYVVSREGAAPRRWAFKGHNQDAAPIWPGRASRNNARGCPLYLVGITTAKNQIHSDLRKTEFGPGYCHHPDYQIDYFRQLTAEQRVTRRKNGQPYSAWVRRGGRRNEALDLHVYNLAVLEGLHLDLDALASKLLIPRHNAAVIAAPQSPQPRPAAQQTRPRRGQRIRIGRRE